MYHEKSKWWPIECTKRAWYFSWVKVVWFFYQIEPVESCGWLRLMLRPSGIRVFSRRIHLSSLCSSIDLVFSLSLVTFSSFSITVNFACFVKSWSCFWKCLSQGGPSILQTSFLCWLILRFSRHSDFPMYCILQMLHSIKYIRNVLLQLTVWNILYSFPVTLLLKSSVSLTCSQHRFPILPLHGWHFPTVSFLLSQIFSLLMILFEPIRSLKFLFLLYAMIGGFSNTLLMLRSMPKIGQCLFTIFFRSGNVLLCVTIKGIRLLDFLGFSFNIVSRGICRALLIWVLISFLS